MTYNTYNGTIKGKFQADGATLGAALADFVLVKDDLRFSVCYSVMNVLTALWTVVLPERALPSRNLLLSMRGFFTSLKPTHDNFLQPEKRQRLKRREKIEHVRKKNCPFFRTRKMLWSPHTIILNDIFLKQRFFHAEKWSCVRGIRLKEVTIL